MEMICSPGSSQSPSALKSIQASSTPPPVTVTLTGVCTPLFKTPLGLVSLLKSTPSSSSAITKTRSAADRHSGRVQVGFP